MISKYLLQQWSKESHTPFTMRLLLKSLPKKLKATKKELKILIKAAKTLRPDIEMQVDFGIRDKI